jgi:hypothetical protein
MYLVLASSVKNYADTIGKPVVENLSGHSYGEWIGKMHEIALRPGTPLMQRDGVWTMPFCSRRGGHQSIVEFLLIRHNGLGNLLEVGAVLSGRGIAGDDRGDGVHKGGTVDVGDIEEV